MCERAAADGARRLTLFSLTESGLFNIDRHLRRKYPDLEIIPVVGNAGNRVLVAPVLEEVDICVHAAAHKHVLLCELNPIEAIINNLYGSFTLARECAEAGVQQFCLISTDKAVHPTSVMGATKRLAELLINTVFRDTETACFAVRFGNVMDSAGSVLPLWREQIAMGGPLTLTDPACTRFFMTIEEAVQLITDVIGLHPSHGVFVRDLGEPKNLLDLANQLIEESGKEIEIQFIGLRPGEKLVEELHHNGPLMPTFAEGVFQVATDPTVPDLNKLMALKTACERGNKNQAVSLLWELAK